MSDAYDFDDDDPSPEAQAARERNQAEMREREATRVAALKRRLRRRPMFQALAAAKIIGLFLFMRWGLAAPETGAANAVHIAIFTVIAMLIGLAVSNFSMHPTNGTSGAMGFTILWGIGNLAVCAICLIAGFSMSAAGIVGIGTLNTVFSAVIGAACWFLTIAI